MSDHGDIKNRGSGPAEPDPRLVVDAIPAQVWRARPDGAIAFVNQQWLEYTGFSVEQSLGWAWSTTNVIHSDDLPGLLDTWRRILASGQPDETEARVQRFDGAYRWFLIRAAPFRNELGQIVEWYGTNTDIDDRKRAQALLTGENRLLEMLAQGQSLASILDGLCRMVEGTFSDSFVSIMLLNPSDNRLWYGASGSLPDAYTEALNGVAVGPSQGSCGTAAYRNEAVVASEIATDPLWLEYRDVAAAYGFRACWSTPIRSSDGRVLGTFAILSRQPGSPTPDHRRTIDEVTHLASVAITRTRTEAALRESEDRLRQMADAIPEVIWITDLEPERVVYTSPSFERVWGLSVDDLYRNPRLWTDTIHGDDRARVASTFSKWIAGGEVDYHDVEFRVVRPNGEVRWIHERGVLTLDDNGRPRRASGISTDITEHKHAEEELRRSEAYLAEAQRLSRTGSFGWSVSTGELFWSKETFSILGYDEKVTPTLDLVFQRVHPDDLLLVQETVARASRDGADLDFEHRVLGRDGSVQHLHVVAHAVRSEAGALEFIGAVSDVTAAMLAQDRIRRDEAEFHQIIDAIPQFIVAMSPGGKILYANESVLEATGLGLQDVMADDFRSRLFHPDDLERVRHERQHGLTDGVPFESEMRARFKDGLYRWFLVHYKPLLDDERRVLRWYATGTDIDDRKRAEERTQNENLALREEINRASMFEEIVGSSSALHRVLRQVAQVAPTDSTVLVTGETGTGKELIARAIHKRSARSTRAFVSVNCAAVPASLMASELFGHERGAFTGALERRQGRFELAEGGTIFLDEVGELSAETQLMLLRVLQEREFQRVGGNRPIRTDVRVVAATNRDLQTAVDDKLFRSDLFYRLNVFPIEVPTLRDRREDIPLLVEYFVHRYAKRAGKKIEEIGRRTLDLLQAYPWPGNIRELQNVLERAVIVSDTEQLTVDERWLIHRPTAPRGVKTPLGDELVAHERARVEAALAESRGRVSGPSGAAARLGIPRSTLESKIRSLKLNKHRFKGSDS